MDARTIRKPLALAIAAALLMPGMAFAQTAKEKDLEARIAQLEAQVHALLGAQQQQQAALTQQQGTLAQAQARLDAVTIASASALLRW